MELDKTTIVISQRSNLDICDLSLIVVRHYATSVILYTFVGAMPFAILNFILMWPMTQYELLDMGSLGSASASFYRTRYYWYMVGAVYLQAPLAFCFVTYFIGHAVFFEEQKFGRVIAETLKRWVGLVWVLGIQRMALLSFGPLIYLFMDPRFHPEIEFFYFFLLMFSIVYFIRMLRPFAPEILVLERCPIDKRKKQGEQQTYGQRSRWLHSTQYSDNIGSHILLTMLSMAIGVSVCFGVVFLFGVLFGRWEWGKWMDYLVFPWCLWMIGAWMTVIRFLLYMNSRIRTEGWEIELRFKAESERLHGGLR